MEEIRVVTGHAQGEITEKKSRFIANVYGIHSEEEALGLLEAVRKKYYDARHNCYAYVLGMHNEIQRFSDDREPSGTAGKPILEVILGHGFQNILIVVTRYFGGILLGTGGLTRAYGAAAKEGIRQAELSGVSCSVFAGQDIRVTCDYNLSGKVQYLIGQMQIPVSEILYEDKVTYHLAVPEDSADLLSRKITEATNAASVILAGDISAYILQNGRPVPYMIDSR